MSIRLRDTNIVADPETGMPKFTSESIELCACSGSGGEAKAFIPVKILNSAGSSPAVATLTELKVSSDTQANSRGVRRVMIKVELPYQSLPETDVRASGGVIDSRRSGQTLSAHLVVSVPRTAAEDLTGSRGIDAQRAMIAQVRGVLSLLLSFTAPEMAGAVNLRSHDTGGELMGLVGKSIPADGLVHLESESVYTTFGITMGVPTIDPNALNGQTGLNFAGLSTTPMGGSDPLWRGLLGQKPLSCQQEVSLPVVDVITH